jgi:hypothetical protein
MVPVTAVATASHTVTRSRAHGRSGSTRTRSPKPLSHAQLSADLGVIYDLAGRPGSTSLKKFSDFEKAKLRRDLTQRYGMSAVRLDQLIEQYRVNYRKDGPTHIRVILTKLHEQKQK